MNNNEELEKINEDPPPPKFGSWNKIYGIVFLTLVALIFLFHLFTKAFE